MKLLLLPGDGIGPEVVGEARRVLEALDLPRLTLFEGDVGAVAYHRHGTPLPTETLDMAREADAVLFGAVGDPSCDDLPRALRPEQAILGLRRELGLFANLRPARVQPGLEALSPLTVERAGRVDFVIVRELTGDVYFGEKGVSEGPNGRMGHDLMSYTEAEVRRIAAIAFETAASRGPGRNSVTSVDKANVLETSRIWRETMEAAASAREDGAPRLSHLYVDNAAMQLVADPGRFDVIVTGNLFGDILSDLAAAITGSIGLIPSASLSERRTRWGLFGLYEPIHGSAPDIAGKDRANPIAAILSVAMALRQSLGREAEADRVEGAVERALAEGFRGRDIGGTVGCRAIGDAVRARL
jgi:3-isopropylmalate dehydrogenase